jgi:MFS family permease
MSLLPWWRLAAISSLGFSLTLASNSLDPAIFSHKILQLAPHQPNTLLGFSTFAASILAILMGPIMGSLSDSWLEKRGNRFLNFLIGIPVMLTALIGIAISTNISVFVLSMLLYRFGDHFAFSPFQALYSDFVPNQQRGMAAGVRSFLDILALLIGRFSAGELLSRAPVIGDRAVLLAVLVPAIALILSLVITIFGTRNLSLLADGNKQKNNGGKQNIRDLFKVDWKKEQAFKWWFINRALFWAAFTIVGTFLLFFIIDVVGLLESEAQSYLARLSLILGLAILLVSIPAGRLADRIGRKPLIVLACTLTAIGSLLMIGLRSLGALSIAGAFVGLGAGIFLSADFALLTEIVPRKEAGRYLGIANIASAGGGAVARLLGGLIIDPINKLSQSASLGYLALYSLASLLFFLSIWAARRLPNSVSKP